MEIGHRVSGGDRLRLFPPAARWRGAKSPGPWLDPRLGEDCFDLRKIAFEHTFIQARLFLFPLEAASASLPICSLCHSFAAKEQLHQQSDQHSHRYYLIGTRPSNAPYSSLKPVPYTLCPWVRTWWRSLAGS